MTGARGAGTADGTDVEVSVELVSVELVSVELVVTTGVAGRKSSGGAVVRALSNVSFF